MNKVIFEKNMQALEQKYPVWAEILRTNKRKKEILMLLQNKVIRKKQF